MSEQAPNLTPPSGPNPDQIDVEAAFDPVARQAQAEMDIYAQNRPYQDVNGATHDPANGNFINPDEYFDEQHQIGKDHSQTGYEDMSIPALAHKLGEAEYYDDKTTQDSVTEALLEKMGAEEARVAGEGGTETEARQDNLWDSVMAAKDLKKRQLEKKNGQPEPGEGDADNPDGNGNGSEDAQGSSDPENGAFDTPELDVPEGVKSFARPAYMEYGRRIEKDDEGNYVDKGPKMAEVYGASGDLMDWSKNPEAQRSDREIILNAEDGNGGQVKWLVKGNKIYEIDLSRPSKTSTATPEPSIKVHELQEGEDLPTMFIGQDIRDGLVLKDVLIATGEDYHAPTRTGARPELPVNPHVRYQPNGRRAMNLHPALVNPRRGRLSSDPFEHLEELTDGDTAGEPDPFNPVGDPTDPNNQPEMEPQINLEEAMKGFSERFEDKTYVPSLDEYEEMRKLASRIRIDYGDEDGKRPIRYLNVDGGQLNAVSTRQFLDRVSRGKWSLKDSEAEYADDIYRAATPLNIERLDTLEVPDRANLPWLHYGEFSDEIKKKYGAGLSDEDLVNEYKHYLDKRIELSDMLTNRQNVAEEYGDNVPEVITPDDMIVDGLKSFSQGIKNERQRRRREAVDRLRNARPDRVARRAARRVRNRS